MAAIEADDLDLTDQVLEFEELPEEAIRTQTALSEDEIPFIDLAEEEE